MSANLCNKWAGNIVIEWLTYTKNFILQVHIKYGLKLFPCRAQYLHVNHVDIPMFVQVCMLVCMCHRTLPNFQ